MASSVTASQPIPRWDPDAPGRTVSTRLSSNTPWAAHGVRSPLAETGETEVVVQFFIDVLQAPRHGTNSRLDRKRQADRMSGSRVRVLPDDQHADILERIGECPQDVLPARQVAPSRCGLGAKKVAEASDLGLGGRQSGGPPRIEKFAERLRTHSQESY